MSDDGKCYAATPAATLEEHILNSNIAKSDTEWWAHHEITRLRAELAHERRIWIKAMDSVLTKEQSYLFRDICAAAAALKETGMNDICERLVRFAGKVCLSTDTEIEAAVEIEKLRDGVRSTIQERDVLSGENWDLRSENEKLRAALKETTDYLHDAYLDIGREEYKAAELAARAALDGTEPR